MVRMEKPRGSRNRGDLNPSTKNAEGELAYKYKNIQSEYVGNLDMLKLYRKRLEAFDILSRATN